MKRIVFATSGQGSQYFHMGKDLLSASPTFRRWLEKADTILFEHVGRSLIDVIYDKKKCIGDPFHELVMSHTSLFAVQYALAKALIAIDIKPQLVFGGSLGEFVAMAIADVLDFESGLEFILKQAKIVEEKCKKGAMIAVFSSRKTISEVISPKVPFAFAVDHGPNNQIISTDEQSGKELKILLDDNNILYKQLPVQFPFHSSLLWNAEKFFLHTAKKLSLKKPKLPLFSCVSAKKMEFFTPKHLWDIVYEPVQIAQTLDNAIDPMNDIVIDISPAGAVALLGESIYGKSNSIFHKTITQFHNGMENIEKILKCL